MTTANLSSHLQKFFAQRLLGQLGVSPHTVSSYRDAFRLLLRFAQKRLGKAPCDLSLDDLDAPFLGRFLDHLEAKRGNCARTRNARVAALHAFLRYVAINEPAHALHCQRILAIPRKRYDRRPVEFLSQEEAAALLASPDIRTWIGRRDRALLLLGIQTGLRNSEIRGLVHRDVKLGKGGHVRCMGKGRKARSTPLSPDTAAALKVWMAERQSQPNDPLFPSSRGGAMSPDAFQQVVARHYETACRSCPALIGRTVTPHTLRHTAAMDLLQHGVDLTVIALWLGHESTETTQMYIHADMRLKEQALSHATASGRQPGRFRAPDRLLAFLESL